MIDLHKRLLTAIPKNRGSFWVEKVNEFYKNNFRNIKPK
jgi:G:T-mismatch repair DNA endonuclease (very short patch repair protein)